MASMAQPQNEAVPNAVSTDADEPNSVEGIGTPSMICPQIRKSHCQFYHWDNINGKHTERPCPFSFVSEKAYLRHVFQTHHLDYACLKEWYMVKDNSTYRREEGEVAGRLPRYPPEAGLSVIDRRARANPVKMIKLLNLMFKL